MPSAFPSHKCFCSWWRAQAQENATMIMAVANVDWQLFVKPLLWLAPLSTVLIEEHYLLFLAPKTKCNGLWTGHRLTKLGSCGSGWYQ